ncbi:MAG: hypothetical protein R2729_17695 [Bryobacteraceae bacterium]
MGIDFDAALKELFEVDRPTLLGALARGEAVREFLNVELPHVELPRADIVARLAGRSILHVEFQSTNDPDIGYRQGIYCLRLGQKFRGDVRQVLVYVGRGRLKMKGFHRTGGTTVEFDVIDIRAFRAEALLNTGNPADLALAMLARGGADLLPEIMKRAGRLRGPARERLMGQLLVLSGLRGLPGKVELEMNRMGVVIDARKNPVLMRYLRDARVEGREEGRQEGRQEGREVGHEEGRRAQLSVLLETKFGRLEPWVTERLARATAQQLDLWARKFVNAERIDQVIRRR